MTQRPSPRCSQTVPADVAGGTVTGFPGSACGPNPACQQPHDRLTLPGAARAATVTAGLTLALLSAGCAMLPAASEPRVQRLVAEDEHVRIDELRVRGQTERLSVQPKSGARAYDIVTPTAAAPAGSRDNAGRRVWPVLSF